MKRAFTEAYNAMTSKKRFVVWYADKTKSSFVQVYRVIL